MFYSWSPGKLGKLGLGEVKNALITFNEKKYLIYPPFVFIYILL